MLIFQDGLRRKNEKVNWTDFLFLHIKTANYQQKQTIIQSYWEIRAICACTSKSVNLISSVCSLKLKCFSKTFLYWLLKLKSVLLSNCQAKGKCSKPGSMHLPVRRRLGIKFVRAAVSFTRTGNANWWVSNSMNNLSNSLNYWYDGPSSRTQSNL